MYRALALKALRHQVAPADESRLEALAKETHIELKPPTPEQGSGGCEELRFPRRGGRDAGDSYRGSGAGRVPARNDCKRARSARGRAAARRARAAAS